MAETLDINPQAGANPASDSADQKQGAQMVVQHVYLKDSSFEAPGALRMSESDGEPEMNMNLSQKAEKLGEGVYEVALTVTVTAKRGETTAFLCETQYAGVFRFQGFSEEQLGYAINVLCPNVLFPYARSQISSLVAAGGFNAPPLQPINFEAIFRQRIEEAQQQQAGQAASDTTQ